jgi:hypothetical protein
VKPDAFFRAREAAEEWVEGREAVVALSLGDAFELGQVQWVNRARRTTSSP